MTAEREPWRAEAEKACLKSGAVKETPDLVRIDPISGPGACGAEFPLKVAALGEGMSSLGYADDLRPPGSIGNQPRWPASQPQPAFLSAVLLCVAARLLIRRHLIHRSSRIRPRVRRPIPNRPVHRCD